MSLDAASLKRIITERIPQTTSVYVEDMSGGCGSSFAVIIVSSEFEGKSKLVRSRLVNTSLRKEIASIHAFTQKTFTPREWESQRINFT